MPDLTIQDFWMCITNNQFQVEIPKTSSVRDELLHATLGKDKYICRYGRTPDGDYDYGWTCECRGFQFRKDCKHIDEAEKQRCGWHQQFDAGEPVDDGNIKRCPECGAEAIGVKCAV